MLINAWSLSTPLPPSATRHPHQVVAVPNPSKTAMQLDFSVFGIGSAYVVMITLIYLDFLDATVCGPALCGEPRAHACPGGVGRVCVRSRAPV